MMIRKSPGTTSNIRLCQVRETHSTASSSSISPGRVLKTNDAARKAARPSTFAADGPNPDTRARAQSRSGYQTGLEHETPDRHRDRAIEQTTQQRIIDQTCGDFPRRDPQNLAQNFHCGQKSAAELHVVDQSQRDRAQQKDARGADQVELSPGHTSEQHLVDFLESLQKHERPAEREGEIAREEPARRACQTPER